MKECIFMILTYFVIYSIAGWMLESVYRSIIEKKIINTGFLFGPFCPIYGIGAIIMFLFFDKFQNNIPLLFAMCVVILSAWEYVGGVCLEKIFKTKYWNYSNQKFNINGRVCLTNSIFWGILGVLFIRFIHPFVEKNIALADPQIFKIVIYSIFTIFILDTITSIVKIKNIKNTLEKIEKINLQVKQKIEEVKKLNSKTTKSEIIESMQKTIDRLNKQKNRTYRRLYARVYRLKKAFPTIETKEIKEILSKKIEFIKKEPKEGKKK